MDKKTDMFRPLNNHLKPLPHFRAERYPRPRNVLK